MANQSMKLWICMSVLFCLWIASCTKLDQMDEGLSSPIAGSEDFVTATIFGKVIDESDNPITDAEVSYRSGFKWICQSSLWSIY